MNLLIREMMEVFVFLHHLSFAPTAHPEQFRRNFAHTSSPCCFEDVNPATVRFTTARTLKMNEQDELLIPCQQYSSKESESCFGRYTCHHRRMHRRSVSPEKIALSKEKKFTYEIVLAYIRFHDNCSDSNRAMPANIFRICPITLLSTMQFVLYRARHRLSPATARGVPYSRGKMTASARQFMLKESTPQVRFCGPRTGSR